MVAVSGNCRRYDAGIDRLRAGSVCFLGKAQCCASSTFGWFAEGRVLEIDTEKADAFTLNPLWLQTTQISNVEDDRPLSHKQTEYA